MDEEKRSQNKRTVNIWKWAFLILLSIVIGIMVWLFTQLMPVTQGEPNLETIDTSGDITFEVNTSKENVNLLVNSYIDEELSNGDVTYQFVLEDQAVFSGTFQLFGYDVPFALYLDPFVMENGNLQFRASQLSIASLNLPITFAMNQIESQLTTIPDWVAIDSEAETIVFNLNEFTLESGIYFSANRIDLEADDIRMNVHIPAD